MSNTYTALIPSPPLKCASVCEKYVCVQENCMEKPVRLMKKSESNCRVSTFWDECTSPGSSEPLISLSRAAACPAPSHTRKRSCPGSVSNTTKCRLCRERASGGHAQSYLHQPRGFIRHLSGEQTAYQVGKVEGKSELFT